MPDEHQVTHEPDRSPTESGSSTAALRSTLSSTLAPAYERAQRVAASVHGLGFARAEAPFELAKSVSDSDLHRYISASARLWQAENNGEQIPPSQLTKELEAIAQTLRIKAADAGEPPPKHPIPVTLPAAQNRLDHVSHRDGVALIEHLRTGLDELCAGGLDEQSESITVGILCTAFAFHCGILNLHEQRALLRTLHQPVHATGKWWHLDLQLKSGRGETLELRRVFLHPYPVAVLIACRNRLSSSKRRPPDKLANENDTALNRIMNSGVKALARALNVPKPHLPLSLDSVLKAEATLQRITGIPLLEAYARRDLISHSPPLNVFRRWHGLAPLRSSGPDNEPVQVQAAEGSDPDHDQNQTGTVAAQSERQLGELRRLFKDIGDRKDRKKALKEFAESSQLSDAMKCLMDFGEATRRGKVRRGRAQKGISVSYLLRDLGPAWLQGTADLNLNALTQQDIESICESVLEQHDSPHKRRRISAGLRAFLHFLEDEGYLTGLDLPDIPRAVGLLAVSANLPTPKEAAKAANDMAQVSGFASEKERLAASAMVQIAATCGLRRNEILHLRVGDLHWGSGGTVEALVRPNVDRNLKSAGSTRLVPLDLAPRDARDRLKRFGEGEAPDTPIISAALGATQATYDWRFFPEMNRALKKSISDKRFHFHHLRHGAATWLLVSLLSNTLRLDRYSARAEYVADAIQASARDKMLLTGNAGPSRKGLFAVSALLGHSSPQITLEHYAHCLDLLLHAQVDSSFKQPRSAAISGLLQEKRRTVQRWQGECPAPAMSQIERKFKAHFLRDTRPIDRKSPTAPHAPDSPSLFLRLEQQWLRVSREQARRDADPGRTYRPPNPLMGQIIDALAEVAEIETDKRGNHARTHRLKSRQRIELPPQLRGGRPRQTAMFVCEMLQRAFEDDFRQTRDAITSWGQHASKERGFFRLSAANSAMRWLLESGHLYSDWYEWGDRQLNPIPRPSDEGLRKTPPPEATHFRLSHPKPARIANRTERSAIWWTLSMSYALIQSGLL